MKIINATPNYQYIYENGKIVKKELSKEKGVITSFIHPRDIFSITKKFDAHLNEEEIFLEMEKYIYSYPGIDINKEYKNIFIKTVRENNIILEALLVDIKDLEKNVKEILDIYKYIDFISPSFLSWEEYYNITKIEPKNDIFIYFDKDEAFLTGFSEGKYLFHKSLNKLNTLTKLLDKSEDEVIEILSTKGLDINKYENESEYYTIDKFFSEFFLKAFNIINFSTNEYQIAKFERIIFYSPFEINALFEQYENYWNLNGIEFKKSMLSTEYNHLEYLITVFNAKNYNNENLNFSVFSKPPAFFNTKAGKFFIFLCFALFCVIGYGLYESYILSKNKAEIEMLQNKYLMLKKRHDLEVRLFGKYKKENKKLKEEIKNIKSQIQNISMKIDILNEKIKEPLFYNILAKISNSMKKYSLKVKNISKSERHITILIVSNSDKTKEITSFMNDLIKFGFKNVKSTFISKNKNLYISKVDFSYE